MNHLWTVSAVWVVHAPYFVNKGPKDNWFCVYWTHCLWAVEREKGEDVEAQGLWGQASSVNATIFSVFTYLTMLRLLHPAQIYLFILLMYHSEIRSSSDDHACTSSVNSACIEACASSSCITYTHSFRIVATPLPHLIPSLWPPGSRAFSAIFSCMLFLLVLLWMSDLSINLTIFPSLYASRDYSYSSSSPISYGVLLSRGRMSLGVVF